MTQPTAGLPQYDAIRQRLKSQFGQRKQEQTDAIQRRFAANGMVGSGAFGKAQDEAAAAVGREEADATAQLDFAEANESQRRAEVKQGQEFQTGERLGAQQFNQGMFDKDMGFKREQAGEQKRQFDTEFAENARTNRLSLYSNLIGDDADDPEKARRMWAQVENIYAGKAPPTPPPTPPPPPAQRYDVGTGQYVRW